MARPIDKTKKRLLVCVICGKQFSRYNSEIKKASKRGYINNYCSKECYAKGKRKPNGGRKFYRCAECGKEFYRSEIHVLRRGVTFAYCSRKCNGLARAKKYIGERHPMWKGEAVGYTGLHKWVSKNLGRPFVCEHCGATENLEWANKSHNYKRSLEDWIGLCPSCHSIYDNILEKSWKTRRELYGHSGMKDKKV